MNINYKYVDIHYKHKCLNINNIYMRVNMYIKPDRLYKRIHKQELTIRLYPMRRKQRLSNTLCRCSNLNSELCTRKPLFFTNGVWICF